MERRNLVALVAIAAVVGLAFGLRSGVDAWTKAREARRRAAPAVARAAELNRGGPRALDADTRLELVTAGADGKLVWELGLLRRDDAPADALHRLACRTEAIRAAVDDGLPAELHFRGARGARLPAVTLTAGECFE